MVTVVSLASQVSLTHPERLVEASVNCETLPRGGLGQGVFRQEAENVSSLKWRGHRSVLGPLSPGSQ